MHDVFSYVAAFIATKMFKVKDLTFSYIRKTDLDFLNPPLALPCPGNLFDVSLILKCALLPFKKFPLFMFFNTYPFQVENPNFLIRLKY